jgi:hypothetical protein
MLEVRNLIDRSASPLIECFASGRAGLLNSITCLD